jgi:Family of unknown function (DUF6262)
MTADNHAHLVAAAKRRSTDTHQRARAALRRLDQTDAPITFAAVADAANVSRSWLYRQPDLRHEIERLRTAQPKSVRSTVPAAQRASQASLQQRLETALDASRVLRQENQKLRDHLAVLLGEQRAAAARHPSTRSVGPCS